MLRSTTYYSCKLPGPAHRLRILFKDFQLAYVIQLNSTFPVTSSLVTRRIYLIISERVFGNPNTVTDLLAGNFPDCFGVVQLTPRPDEYDEQEAKCEAPPFQT